MTHILKNCGAIGNSRDGFNVSNAPLRIEGTLDSHNNGRNGLTATDAPLSGDGTIRTTGNGANGVDMSNSERMAPARNRASSGWTRSRDGRMPK